jgi:hypothetical protein
VLPSQVQSMFPFTVYYIPHTRDWERKMYCRFFHYRQVNSELGKELSAFRRFLAHNSREVLVSVWRIFSLKGLTNEKRGGLKVDHSIGLA